MSIKFTQIWTVLVFLLICKSSQLKESGLSIYLLTFNTAEEYPPSNLVSMFTVKSETPFQYDMYVIALEELSYSSLFNSNKFQERLVQIFEEAGYEELVTKRFVMISLAVFVKKELKVKFTDVQFTKKSTDLWLRKGGVAIRVVYRYVAIVFVGAHLAAHDEKYEERLSDYHQIMDNIEFAGSPRKILDHDFVFFMGDLNFRINDPMTQDKVNAAIKVKNWSNLLKYDQLKKAHYEGTAFSCFNEPPINFPPTFKFKIGTTKYNPKRKPAYTDRILWLSTHSRSLEMTHYDSLPQITSSDHKPVRAVVNILEDAFKF